MRRVVVDSNAMDPLMDLPGAYETIRAAVDAGDLEILFTHVTIEELAAIPDYERRCRLLIFLVDLGRLVATGAFIVGASRLDFGRLSDDTESLAVLTGSGETHLRDALIAATALVDDFALVTYDARLTARARERGVEVLRTDELLTELRGTQRPSIAPGG
jgi:predicted nucleic acid-binding protein